MSDPRTELYNVLSRRLTEEMVARDDAWADYWQRRRIVVVPDNHMRIAGNVIHDSPKVLNNAGDEPGRGSTIRTGVAHENDDIRVSLGIANQTSTTRMADVLVERRGDAIIRDCIVRLKAARGKESVNRNLSTLLAVVVKVQRDLEVLLNGAGETR